jgi:hypothetical protein
MAGCSSMKAFLGLGAAALALAGGSAAATKTTAPSNKVTVLVVIDDKGMKVSTFVGIGVGPADKNDPDNDPTSIQVLRGPIPRGDYLSFNIMNRGKKAHDFTAFGKKTKPIKPGKTAHLFAQALSRGSFGYRSTLDKGKAFRGQLTIF